MGGRVGLGEVVGSAVGEGSGVTASADTVVEAYAWSFANVSVAFERAEFGVSVVVSATSFIGYQGPPIWRAYSSGIVTLFVLD